MIFLNLISNFKVKFKNNKYRIFVSKVIWLDFGFFNKSFEYNKII